MFRISHKALNSFKFKLNPQNQLQLFNSESVNYNFLIPKQLSSNAAFLDISGIYPPITTPFDKKYDISFDKLLHNLNKWKSIPFKGYVLLGSTGEFPFLSEEEKINLVKYVKSANHANKLVVVGTGCDSTNGTIDLTNKMADVGADAALLISPFFYKGRMTDDALYNHYITVAEASKIPIILYSVPANTGIDLTATLVAKLADHPNIIGLKDSGGDITKIGLIVHKTKGKNFQVLAGSAGFLYSALCVGCVGGVLALANPLGGPTCQLYQHFIREEHVEARKLQHQLIEPNLAVTKQFGIPGVKVALDMFGYHGGVCRPPLNSLNTQESTKLREVFEKNGFL